jgi:hypothetical protein
VYDVMRGHGCRPLPQITGCILAPYARPGIIRALDCVTRADNTKGLHDFSSILALPETGFKSQFGSELNILQEVVLFRGHKGRTRSAQHQHPTMRGSALWNVY